jgi:hypothetical protein
MKTAPKRLAMSYKRQESTQWEALQYIHLPHLALPPGISLDASDRIPYPPALGAHFFVESFESVTAVDPAVWQYHRIILHDALGMVCVGNVARQFIQLGAADRTDGSGGRGSVRRGGCICGVACGSLERGKSGGQGNVKEWSRWKRVEAVMCRKEEGR